MPKRVEVAFLLSSLETGFLTSMSCRGGRESDDTTAQISDVMLSFLGGLLTV